MELQNSEVTVATSSIVWKVFIEKNIRCFASRGRAKQATPCDYYVEGNPFSTGHRIWPSSSHGAHHTVHQCRLMFNCTGVPCIPMQAALFMSIETQQLHYTIAMSQYDIHHGGGFRDTHLQPHEFHIGTQRPRLCSCCIIIYINTQNTVYYSLCE